MVRQTAVECHTCPGRNSSTVKVGVQQIYAPNNCRVLTPHLGGIHVELVGDDTGESRNQHRKNVIVAVEEGVRSDYKNDLRGNLVPHRKSDRYLC